MTEARGNLLHDPVIGVRTAEWQRGMSLAEVLSALGRGTELEFSALRPFQHHAWQAFLTQLAAILLDRGHVRRLSAEVEEWAAGMRELSDGFEEPWCLVFDDVSKPAFLQPPIREDEESDYKRSIAAPDDIDLLIKRTKHSVKAHRIHHAELEHWLFALISLQTCGGYPGGGGRYQGVSRMNRGYGNRPGIVFAQSDLWSVRFKTEVSAWLDRMTMLCDSYGYSSDGSSLLWLAEWDGTDSIDPSELHPAYVEICRRVRLSLDTGERVLARLATNPAPRVAAKERKGDTGDLWTPVGKKDGAALTVGPQGLSYQLMRDVMFGGEYETPTRDLRLASEGGSAVLIARALARGQGKTEGYHFRTIPIPPSGARYVFSADARHLADALSRARAQRASDAWQKLLRPALCVLLQGAPARLDLSDDRTAPWRDRFHAQVDAIFFESLWSDIEEENDPGVRWDRTLIGLCEGLLREAMASTPIASGQRYRILAAAESLFFACRRKHFRETLPLPNTSNRTNERSRDAS